MASKKRKKAKKPAKRGRKKSAARASSAKRGKSMTLSMAQLRALTGGGKSRKKGKRGGRGRSSDHFDFAMGYGGGKLPSFAGMGVSALERRLLADVNRSARAVEALDEKTKEQDRRDKERERAAKYRDLSQEFLDELRAERSAKTAEREAKLKLAIAKHRDLVNRTLERLATGAENTRDSDTAEVIRIAKDLGKVRKAS